MLVAVVKLLLLLVVEFIDRVRSEEDVGERDAAVAAATASSSSPSSSTSLFVVVVVVVFLRLY